MPRCARFPLLALALFATLPGCGLARFTVGVDVAEQRIGGSPLGGLLGNVVDVPIPLEVDLASETAARGTGPAQHVYLDSLELRITPTEEPPGDADDWDFVDAIEIYVESAQAGSTLPRVRVAHLDAAPAGARVLALEPDDVDLIEYVRQGARLTSSASGRAPPDDVSFDGRVTLGIEVL